jgi:hypothetical protein
MEPKAWTGPTKASDYKGKAGSDQSTQEPELILADTFQFRSD